MCSIALILATRLKSRHAHLLVLLNLDVHLRGCVWEGAAAIGLPEEVGLSHLYKAICRWMLGWVAFQAFTHCKVIVPYFIGQLSIAIC